MKKLFLNKKFKITLHIFLAIVILAGIIIPLSFSKPDVTFHLSDRNWFGPIYYAVCFLASAVMVIIFIWRFEKKNLFALLTFIFASIALAGYLILSLSNGTDTAMIANRISYFGNVFLLPILFLTFANICKIKIKKTVVALMFFLAFAMFLFAFSAGYLDLFYKEPSFVIVNGFTKINKTYGPLHTVYVVYVFCSILAIALLMVYASIKKRIPSKKLLALIYIMIFLNAFVWMIERFLPYTVEYLAVSYVVTEIILLFVYKQLHDRGVFDVYNVTLTFQDESKMSVTVRDVYVDTFKSNNSENKLLLINEEEFKEKLNKIFKNNNLTDREKDVVFLMVKGYKRREIAEKLFVSEETVKTHAKHIFQKLNISSHEQLKQKAIDSLGKK